MVFFSHLVGTLQNTTLFGFDMQKSPLRIFWGGNAAVMIFFVLSGFFYWKSTYILNIRNYLIDIYKRHKRIYPVFLIVLIGAVLLRITCPMYAADEMSSWFSAFWTEPFPIKKVLKTFFLISSFDSHLINPVIWTLRVEMRMIFVLPFVLFFMKKLPPILVWILTIPISLFVPQLFYLAGFSSGMVTRELFEKHNISKWLSKRSIRIMLSVFGIILLDTEYLLNFFAFSLSSALTGVITAIGASVIVLLLYSRGRMARKIYFPLVKIGDFSYCFYLTHFVIMLWLRFLYGTLSPILFAVLCLILTIGISALLFKLDVYFQKQISGFDKKLLQR